MAYPKLDDLASKRVGKPVEDLTGIPPAQPFGYGRVQLSVEEWASVVREQGAPAIPPTLEDLARELAPIISAPEDELMIVAGTPEQSTEVRLWIRDGLALFGAQMRSDDDEGPRVLVDIVSAGHAVDVLSSWIGVAPRWDLDVDPRAFDPTTLPDRARLVTVTSTRLARPFVFVDTGSAYLELSRVADSAETRATPRSSRSIFEAVILAVGANTPA